MQTSKSQRNLSGASISYFYYSFFGKQIWFLFCVTLGGKGACAVWCVQDEVIPVLLIQPRVLSALFSGEI